MISSPEQMDCSDGYGSYEVFEQLVGSCGDAAEVSEFFEAALNGVAFFVKRPVAGMGSATVEPRRDDRCGSSLWDSVVDVFGVIGTATNNGTA